jgi:serine/threonine protein kinase
VPEIRLVRRRRKKNVLREIFFYEGLVVKRFVRLGRFWDARPVWRMEDQALRRLSGHPFPATYGYRETTFRGAKEILYAREFVDGVPVERIDDRDLSGLAHLMAWIHHRGVLTCDPAPDNFIRKEDGSLLFIDFGRAKVIADRGVRYLYHLGKELARIQHHALSSDKQRFERFYAVYRKKTGLSVPRQAFVDSVRRLWALRWRLRQRRRLRRTGPAGRRRQEEE